jgi:uncharacterized membrane protein YjgN (DUF898 family)
MDEERSEGEPGDAFAFTGTWRDYLPIALSNLLLTIVTLGVYRFWAKARERRYLWSHTRFIDDRLEWTGTGREMFVGFLIAMLLFGPAFLFIRFGAQALVLRGHPLLAGLLFALTYVFLLYVFGLARFRGLRYRLSRTYWHGIRGGSDESGLVYGWSSVWKTLVGYLAFALLVPWAAVRLWSERWSAMSFGPHRFESRAFAGPLMLRWLLLLFSPIMLVVIILLVGFVAADAIGFGAGRLPPPAAIVVTGVVLVAGVYFLIGLIGLFYYAAFYRQVLGGLSLGGLDFEFDARSKDWLLLFLGDIALIVCTLGLGICFLGYRHWAFLIRHLGATGEVDLASLTQSHTRAPREAEGFADAFDLGAI